MRRVVLAALLAISAPCYADTWLVASVTSFHQERGRYNEFNPGIGGEYGGDTWRAVAGAYLNSLSRETKYAGVSYTPLHFGRVSVGSTVILATGYSAGISILPLPVVAYEGRRYGANLIIVPPREGKGGVLGLQLKKKFQ